MKEEAYKEIVEALVDREDWEDKQDGFYRLRHRRVGRRYKPYANAPDMRYGLADTLIEKVKPLYIGQLYADQHIATMVSVCSQEAAWTTAAEEWFDYQLKQCSNLQKQMFIAVDKHLEAGFVPMKVYWNPDKEEVCFDACEPLKVIVPEWTEDDCDPDWLVHVLVLSEAQYRRNSNFVQDDDFIKRIKGKGSSQDSGASQLHQSKAWREGLTYGESDQIVLWECWMRDGTGNDAGWTVETIAPVCGPDEPVRAPFGNPYDHGKLPFFFLRAEIIDKGYYSPRGITEVTAPHEMSLNKSWNAKLTFLDFSGVPSYEQDVGSNLVNTQNLHPQPGSIMPPGLHAATVVSAPIAFDEEMQFTRALAEDRVRVPDLSASEHLTGNVGNRDRVTATQINAIVGQSNESSDLRARTFHLFLCDGLRLAWALYVQFKTEDLKYLHDKTILEVPPGALHTDYIIQPSGSPDSWNKQAQMQRRLGLYQTVLRGNPFIQQGEATKWLLEAEDPAMIMRMYQDPGEQSADQEEQQAVECLLMEDGFVPHVHPADDDKVHLMTLAGFYQRKLGMNEPVSPELARAGLMHGMAHEQGMQQKKDPARKQINQQLAPLIQVLQQIASQPDQPGNVVPMTQQSQGMSVAGGGSLLSSSGSAPGAAAPPPSPQETAKDQADISIKAGNMLAGLIKSGVSVSAGEINTIFRQLGLPDLPSTPISPPAPVPHPTQPAPPPPQTVPGMPPAA